MAGKSTLDELKQVAVDGEIDTVIAAQIDMQSRLMGKRLLLRTRSGQLLLNGPIALDLGQ